MHSLLALARNTSIYLGSDNAHDSFQLTQQTSSQSAGVDPHPQHPLLFSVITNPSSFLATRSDMLIMKTNFHMAAVLFGFCVTIASSLPIADGVLIHGATTGDARMKRAPSNSTRINDDDPGGDYTCFGVSHFSLLLGAITVHRRRPWEK